MRALGPDALLCTELAPAIAAEELPMDYPAKNEIPYEEIANGALILQLLRESQTWEKLCERYAYADPVQLRTNTNSLTLPKKLQEMRELGLIGFDEEETSEGKKPVGVG